MLDYVRHRPLLTRSQPNRFGSLVVQCLFILSLCLVDLHGQSALDHSSLRTMLQRRQPTPARRLLRVVYFRKFDVTVDETRLRNDVRNVTESFGIDFRLNILNQSSSLLATKLCAILSQEPLDTVLIADLYTKEIDLISRSLQMPTIAITNGYQLVQGKQVSHLQIIDRHGGRIHFAAQSLPVQVHDRSGGRSQIDGLCP